MSFNCTPEYPDLSDYIAAGIGVNAGSPAIRVMQVESVKDYFDCNRDLGIDTIFNLFRKLIDLNHYGEITLRVDIQTDDSAAVKLLDCYNKEMDWFTALKFAIGEGADGNPVLRIMQSSGLS